MCCQFRSSPIVYGMTVSNICEILVNSSLPEHNGHPFTDNIFKCIFMNETFCVLIRIPLKFIPIGSIISIPLSEPMVASLLTHVCVTRPQ